MIWRQDGNGGREVSQKFSMERKSSFLHIPVNFYQSLFIIQIVVWDNIRISLLEFMKMVEWWLISFLVKRSRWLFPFHAVSTLHRGSLTMNFFGTMSVIWQDVSRYLDRWAGLYIGYIETYMRRSLEPARKREDPGWKKMKWKVEWNLKGDVLLLYTVTSSREPLLNSWAPSHF